MKKTPGYVFYENGEFKYTKTGGSKIFQSINKWGTQFGIFIFSFFTATSLGMVTFGKNGTAITGFVFLIISSSLLASQIRQRNYDRMVENLVQPVSSTVATAPEL